MNPMTVRCAFAAGMLGASLALVGCTSGSRDEAMSLPAAKLLPPVEIPELTPEAQPFRKTGTSFVDGVLSIDVPIAGNRTLTLDTVRDLERTWGLYLPRPVQPGHSSREWMLANNHHDGRVLLYALASWNETDPADYLAAGWWLLYPPDVHFRDFESADRGVFLDGPELDPSRPPDLPLAGKATYSGGMGGLYTYNYGRSWGSLDGSAEVTEFAGPVLLTADFDSNRLTGCLGCAGPIETAPGRHLFPAVPWGADDPTALPTDYEVRFEASFDTGGSFENSAVTVTHPERVIVSSAGTWQGQFSNMPDAGGNPRRVVGSTDALFAEEDGSHGRFTGIFDALTPAPPR